MNRISPMLRNAAIAAAVVASTAGAAHAQSLNGLYFGVGGGWTHYDINYNQQVVNAYDYFLSPYTVDYANFGNGTQGGFKTWLGYQFLPWLGAEVSYVNLGSPDANYSVTAATGPSINPNTRNATYKIQGMNLSAIATLPINEMFAVHANVGAFYSQLKYSESGTNGNGSAYSFTAPNLWQWNLSYGAGANYNINKQWTLRFDWDRFQDIGNTFALTTEGNGKFDNIDLFTFNVIYRF